MAISPGARLGAYQITGLLGAGGMGEVYGARDTRLDRDVAIKILPALFAEDPERLARFEREAKTLASLNHPHIAQIYGLEPLDAASGGRALVMELVDGEDLSARIARGPIPFADALPIARQIAEALEAAHERGIIHRDLKPANVKVRGDGTVKVLDFGLAKAIDPAGGSNPDMMHSPTITSPATQLGVVLGTAAYMSPEQAKGKAVDKRADIWAFGCVLYEMLTGRRPFEGDNVTETLAAVIRGEPAMAALGPDVPDSIRRLINRCLRKDARARLRDIGDARHVLEEPHDGDAEKSPPHTAARIWVVLPWTVAAAAVIAAVVAWPRGGATTGATAPVRRFAIDLPWHSVPNWTDFDVVLSPTATHVAYYGRRPNENDVSVYVRPLDSLEGVPLADARETLGMAFSPDGEWIALLDPGGLRKVSIHGGRAQPLARVDGGYGISWGADGSVLVGHQSGLLRATAAGGAAEPLTRINTAAGETAHVDPFHLPNGTHVLMAIARGEQHALAVVDIARRTYQSLAVNGAQPAWSPSGHLVFRQGKSVMAAAFDLETLRVTSDAVPILEAVRRGPYVATDGTMIYVPERTESTARLVWVDRGGRSTPIAGERLDYSHLSVGAGGRQALLNLAGDVYVRDIERGARRLLSSHGSFPIWSPDARWATYTTGAGGVSAIVRHPADGSAPPETLVTSKEGVVVPTSWNARTGDLAYFDHASDIWIRKPDGSSARLLSSSFNERSGSFSPDGRWLAYVSDETGAYQVYVVPYPGPGPKVAVSIDGGMAPIWSPDGRELFFRRGGRMLAASVTFSPTLSAGRPTELFEGPFTLDFMGHQRYDVAHDGRFLMVEDSGNFRTVVVERWTEEVKRLVARGMKP